MSNSYNEIIKNRLYVGDYETAKDLTILDDKLGVTHIVACGFDSGYFEDLRFVFFFVLLILFYYIKSKYQVLLVMSNEYIMRYIYLYYLMNDLRLLHLLLSILIYI